MVSPGWSATRPSTAVRLRVDISAKDSPPGNRNPLGQRWTVGHSLLLVSRASDFSVQSPTSASSSPRVDADPQPERRGDGGGRLTCPLERRGVDGRGRRRHGGDPFGHHVGLGPALVGQMQAGGPAGQHLAGGRGRPVADQQDEGRRRGFARRGATGRRADGCGTGPIVCSAPWSPNRARAELLRAVQREVARLPALPAAGALAGAGGRGTAGPRSPASPTGDAPCPGSAIRGARSGRRRPGAGRPRGEPDRAHVHRRPIRGLALRGAVPGRVRLPTDQHRRETTACVLRGVVHHGRGALCAAGQQARAERTGGLRALPGPRTRAARAT